MLASATDLWIIRCKEKQRTQEGMSAMTKKQMLDTMVNEYILSMNTYRFFKNTMNDSDGAKKYWIEALQTEYLIKKLFGDDVDVYGAYLDYLDDNC